MISRLTLSSLVFAITAATSLAYAASVPASTPTSSATSSAQAVTATQHITLERVVIVSKRLPLDA